MGYANAYGVYQEYYQTHQLSDHSSSTISWIGSVQSFFLLSGTLFGGPLFNRFGSIVIWPPAMTYVFTVMMTSICKTFWQFMLAQGILGGLARGMTMAPGMAAISQYSQKKRGAAIGIAVAESSVGGVVLPIALGRMLYNPRLGLGWTVRISGFIMLALLLVSTTAIRARLPPRKNQFLLLSAFRNLQYLLIIVAAFLTVLGMFTPIFYLPSHAVQTGMGTQLAFYLVAILSGASFFGRVIPGVAADKVGRFNVLSASALCTGVLILCWQKSKSNASIIVFAALYGLCSVAIVSSMSVCLARVPKDPKDIGTYLGMGMFVLSFGALVGPPINGALVARYGGFDEVSMLSGLVALAGGCVAFLAKQQTDEGLFGRV